jgi:hypothetical protein
LFSASPVATARELTEPYLQIFTRVPPSGPGVCSVCHRAPNAGFARCYSCAQSMRQVSHPIDRVVPISLYQVGDQLHTWLRGYKDDRSDTVRSRLRPRVAATIWRFLDRHTACIAPSGWELVTAVPSTAARSGPHPLETVLGMIPTIRE